MNTMSYKGYLARIEYSAEDHLFVGHLAGIQDIIGFHGTTVEELEHAFYEAVDDYLAMCAKLRQRPNPAVDGILKLQVSPEVHARVVQSAELAGKSPIQWASETLEKAVAG